MEFLASPTSEAICSKLAAALDSAASKLQLRQLEACYVQQMQHEHSMLSELASCLGLQDALDADIDHLPVLQRAQIVPPRVLIIAGSDSGGGGWQMIWNDLWILDDSAPNLSILLGD